jgi:hypothetical protein
MGPMHGQARCTDASPELVDVVEYAMRNQLPYPVREYRVLIKSISVDQGLEDMTLYGDVNKTYAQGRREVTIEFLVFT